MKATGDASSYVPRQGPTARGGCDVERWEIRTTISQLRFVLRHIVIHDIHGRFTRWGGTLYLDRANPELSSVEVWVDLASIDTESEERDDHVRSAEFFDVARFPRAEFTSTSLELGRDRVLLRGVLALHGVRHDVELEVGPRSGPSGGLRNVYRVSGKIDRQAFGLHWNQDLDSGGVVVGDEVEIEANVELVPAE